MRADARPAGRRHRQTTAYRSAPSPARGRFFRPTHPPRLTTRPKGNLRLLRSPRVLHEDRPRAPAANILLHGIERRPRARAGAAASAGLPPHPRRDRGEPFERTTHEGALDVPHAPRREDPYAGGGMRVAAGRPMDRTRGMENSPDAFAADCTAVDARFPHRLVHRPPAGPQPPVHVGPPARRCAVARPHAAASRREPIPLTFCAVPGRDVPPQRRVLAHRNRRAPDRPLRPEQVPPPGVKRRSNLTPRRHAFEHVQDHRALPRRRPALPADRAIAVARATCRSPPHRISNPTTSRSDRERIGVPISSDVRA